MFILIGVMTGMAISWIAGSLLSTEKRLAPRTVTDYLHAVIEADRNFYAQEVVERMRALHKVTASEQWKKENQLPLPTQFLLEASQGLQMSGKPFHYRLISLWPINPANFPSSEADHRALERVVHEGVVVETQIYRDDTEYFQAIYPDRANSRKCVNCHNSHDKSPKRDFKMNDVMGGLEILIPID